MKVLGTKIKPIYGKDAKRVHPEAQKSRMPKVLSQIVLFLVIFSVLITVASVVIILNDLYIHSYSFRETIMQGLEWAFKVFFSLV